MTLTPFSVTEKRSRQKIRKAIDDLNSTINPFDPDTHFLNTSSNSSRLHKSSKIDHILSYETNRIKLKRIVIIQSIFMDLLELN